MEDDDEIKLNSAKTYTVIFGLLAYGCNLASGICASIQYGDAKRGMEVNVSLSFATFVLYWVSVTSFQLACIFYFQVPAEQHSWDSVRQSLDFAREWASRRQPVKYATLVSSIDEALKEE